MKVLKQIISIVAKYFWDWPFIIYFNLKAFPIKTAILLPVFLHKTEIRGQGQYIIESTFPISMGMIRIGHRHVSHYPDNGAILENRGRIIFKGSLRLGNGCAVSVGENAELIFGDGFCATGHSHIICRNKIIFSKNVLCGWSTVIMDTNFHRIKNISGEFTDKGYGLIDIGSNCWIASGCKILPNTKTPNRTIVAANAVLNHDYTSLGENIILGGIPAKLIKRNFYWDKQDDLPLYVHD